MHPSFTRGSTQMRHQLHFAWLWSMDFWRATPNQTIDLHTVEQVILQRVSRNVTGWHGIHRRLAQESRPNRTVSYVHSMVLDQSAIRLRQYADNVVFLLTSPVPCFQRFHSVIDYKVACTKEYHRSTVEQSNSSDTEAN